MAYALTDDYDPPRMTPAVLWLIGLNVAVFFVQSMVVGAADMQRALGFEIRDLTDAWWTIFTYMFVHASLVHLALNMYALYLFGPRVEHHWSAGGFTRYYLLCGLGGWFAHLLVARDTPLVGASAAVYGVMLAYAMNWPDDEVALFGVVPMKVKWLVALLAVSSLVLGIASADAPGGGPAHLAHFGGFAVGWLYFRKPTARSLERLRQRISPAPDTPDETPRIIPPRALPRVRDARPEIDQIIANNASANNANNPNAAKSRLVARQPAAAPQAPAPPRASRSDEMDLVLDKISRQGIDSLTSDERRLLEEMSRRLRNP